MATKLITRTITTTEVNALCLNIETAEPFNKSISIPGVFTNKSKLEKAVSKVINNETEKFVHIVDEHTLQTLYGMSEETFIANAKTLPPRGTKAEA